MFFLHPRQFSMNENCAGLKIWFLFHETKLKRKVKRMSRNNHWKSVERMISREFFNSERNPLSGGNSRHDDGTPRRGDSLYPHMLVEIKYRKRVSPIARAMGTRDEANSINKPFIHIERMHNSDLYNVTLTKELMHVAIDAIKKYVETPKSLKTTMKYECDEPIQTDGNGNV